MLRLRITIEYAAAQGAGISSAAESARKMWARFPIDRYGNVHRKVIANFYRGDKKPMIMRPIEFATGSGYPAVTGLISDLIIQIRIELAHALLDVYI